MQKTSEKISNKQSVREMFDNIAPQYDFLNHFLSMGIDKKWRKKLRAEMAIQKPDTIIDIATGTGDLAFELVKLKPKTITGIDISENMLAIAKQKAYKRKLDGIISFQSGDSLSIPFNDNSFDAASIAFGIRNFENPDKGLREVFRVLRPGGKIYILEFGMPEKQPFKSLYKFYFLRITPFIGRLLSGNKSAYKYLPSSVESFKYGDAFAKNIKAAGFYNISYKKLSQGIAYLYAGSKLQSCFPDKTPKLTNQFRNEL